MKHLTASATMLVLDFIVVRYFMKPIFDKQIKDVQHADMALKWVPAALSYFLMLLGLNLFVVGFDDLPPHLIAYRGSLFGCILYGTFESVNLALLSDWSWHTAMCDTLWGTILFTISGYVGGIGYTEAD